MKIDFDIKRDQKYHQYCPHCKSKNISRVFVKEKTYYYCKECKKKYSRMIVIDPKIKWRIDPKTKEYWHESVGVFIFNKENKILLFERSIYPFACTIPAGHVDAGERVKEAIIREVKEEVGINLSNIKLFSEENVVGDKCRRGADNHFWHLYVAKINHNVKINVKEEGDKAEWLSIDAALKKKLVYPVRYFINKYGDDLMKSINEKHN